MVEDPPWVLCIWCIEVVGIVVDAAVVLEIGVVDVDRILEDVVEDG